MSPHPLWIAELQRRDDEYSRSLLKAYKKGSMNSRLVTFALFMIFTLGVCLTVLYWMLALIERLG